MRKTFLATTMALGLLISGSVLAGSTGVISFRGAVYEPTLTVRFAGSGQPVAPSLTTVNTMVLSKARLVAPSPLLDYYAQYAATDAQLMTVVYR
ncbi:hypothetical protein [Dyella sp.]|uniref:hypothetical protein n=1 Tax=Dyella sp. TaxID=1869338 RepID=UPI002ED3AE03